MSCGRTLSASFGWQTNAITRANSIGFERQLRAYLANFAVSHTLTTRDLVQLSLASSFYDGFQSSPYRYITVQDQALLENYPDTRLRQAVVARHHHYFTSGWALKSHARFYADTYGVEALTLGMEAAWERAPFDWALALRGYGQTRARFYRESYPEPRRYMSLDKELSRFVDVFLGPSVGFHRSSAGPFADLRLDARVSAFYFRFFEFEALDDRYGVVADVGASATF